MRFSTFAAAFLVEDVAACRDFFVSHLGCAVAVDLGWYADLTHPSAPSFRLDFVTRGHPSMPVAGQVGGAVLAFVVEDAAAVEIRLRDAGVEIIAPCRDEPWGQRHFFAASPGPVVEFVQPIEPDPEWISANSP
ncbi:VOC family protein [Actinokineospora sp. NBRC 105648]|uniref:VOC family protein n=1 Tax=Actinokineospora sp. NBRC 105648 TaxID=3032206 RepID=UPI0024A37AD4|nr:VOC family protein [Actinokineospora sp. NBRC 105648]GLZ43376.1 glyoxalase [Actinokineospora sp. NBRC 105648]